MIDPTTGLDTTPKPTYTDTVQQPNTISASVTPLNINIGGSKPTDALNTKQVTTGG